MQLLISQSQICTDRPTVTSQGWECLDKDLTTGLPLHQEARMQPASPSLVSGPVRTAP